MDLGTSSHIYLVMICVCLKAYNEAIRDFASAAEDAYIPICSDVDQGRILT
jgi:hypothetical protein